MATTRIEPIHINTEWGAAQTIKRTTDYMKNPDKTNGGLLIDGFGCNPDIVTDDFMFSRDEYQLNTGRNQGENEVLAYHVRQSFLPGEADIETVRRLGCELAMEITGGNFSFIVCTHTDKNHLHNHIVINAVNLDCDKKFRNEVGSFRRVQRISDRICRDNILSVVENPALSKNKRPNYKTPTKRDGLAGIINNIFGTDPPKSFEDLLKQLEKNGCKVRKRGKTISIQPPGAERFFRLKAGKKGLPEGYDEDSLRKRIEEMQADLQDGLCDEIGDTVHADAPATDRFSFVEEEEISRAEDKKADGTAAEPSLKYSHDKKINLLIDIENSIKAQSSPGYERWAKGFNLQQAAETLLFLQTNNLTDIEALTHAASQVKNDYDALQTRIDNAEARIKEVNILQRHIGAYHKNRDVYSQYLRSKRNPKFREENENAIATVEEAKAFFIRWGCCQEELF